MVAILEHEKDSKLVALEKALQYYAINLGIKLPKKESDLLITLLQHPDTINDVKKCARLSELSVSTIRSYKTQLKEKKILINDYYNSWEIAEAWVNIYNIVIKNEMIVIKFG